VGHLQDTMHIRAPVEKIITYMDDPHNWSTYMVGMSGPDQIVGDGGPGTQYEFTIVSAGLHMHETGRQGDKLRDPDGGAHTRMDFEGTTSGWQSWDFKPEDAGTLVTVEMEYSVPGSLLGKVADRLIIERMQERDIHHSLENLKALMEGPTH
jgi:hypothetical protein